MFSLQTREENSIGVSILDKRYSNSQKVEESEPKIKLQLDLTEISIPCWSERLSDEQVNCRMD